MKETIVYVVTYGISMLLMKFYKEEITPFKCIIIIIGAILLYFFITFIMYLCKEELTVFKSTVIAFLICIWCYTI